MNTKDLLLNHPVWLVTLTAYVGACALSGSSHGDLVQANILDGGPNNRQATVLSREHVNLVGALAHIAEEALDGIGRLNMMMHGRGKGIKRLDSARLRGSAEHIWP